MATKTLGQQRAAHAWNAVERAFQALPGEKFSKEFADPAKKLPMQIRSSGLGQVLAFHRSKGQASAVREALGSWCKEQGITRSDSADALLELVRTGPAASLRRATAESLAYLEWLVRFADARKKGKA